MIGSLIIRGLVMVFGYAYPAYECYKTVDRNKTDVEKLRFWCQYWILVAMLTVFERVGDALISCYHAISFLLRRVPMYSEAKLFLYIYLWYPKTKGTTYIYDSFFRPYVAKHETEIDRNLFEMRTRTGDYVVLVLQKATNYTQTRIVDIVQFISLKLKPKPPSPQPRRNSKVRQSAATKNLEAAFKAQPQTAASKSQLQTEVASKAQPQTEESTSPSKISSSESHEVLVIKTKCPSEVPTAALAAAVFNATNSNKKQPVRDLSKLLPHIKKQPLLKQSLLNRRCCEPLP